MGIEFRCSASRPRGLFPVPHGFRSHLASLRLCVFALIPVCLVALNAVSAEVARVGAQVINTEQVRQAVARGGYNVFELDSAKKALDDVINSEVLAAAARQRGYEKNPEIAERIKQLLVEKFVQDNVDKPLQAVTPTEEELQNYYEAHKAEFSQPGLARAQMVTFMVREGKADAALTRANEAVAALKGGKTFEEICAQNSDDPAERVSKGAATWFNEGQVNRRYPAEVTSALFKLAKPGELAGPITTQRGVYLVKLVEKRPAIIRTFTEAKAGVTRAVLHEKRQKAYAELCAKLRREFPVKVDESQLKSAVEKSAPGDGPPRGPGPQ